MPKNRTPRLPKTSRRGNITKRAGHGRIIKTEYRADGREWQLHSTRGWRSYRMYH